MRTDSRPVPPISIRSPPAISPIRIRRRRRCAKPVRSVRLTRYNVWAVARYQEVFAILNDWRTFSSARGVGLTDFKKEKPWRLPSLVLETDPPLHDRTRKVLDGVLSPAAMRGLRARFAEAADRLIDELLERGSFDAVAGTCRGVSAGGVSRRGRHAAGEPPLSAAVRQHGVQLVRSAQRVLRGRGARRRTGTGLGAGAVAARRALAGRLRCRGARRRRCRPADRRRSADRRAFDPDRRRRHHGERDRRRGVLPGALSRSVQQAARQPDAGARRVRGSGAVRKPGADVLPHDHARRGARRPADRRGREGPDVPRRGQSRPAQVGAARRLRHRTPHRRPCRLRLRHPQCVGQVLARLEGECVLTVARAQGRIDRDHRPGTPALQQHAARAGEPAGDDARGVVRFERVRCSAVRAIRPMVSVPPSQRDRSASTSEQTSKHCRVRESSPASLCRLIV